MSASSAPRRSALARFLIALGGLMLTPGLFVLILIVGSFFGPHPFFQPDDPYADLVTSVLIVTLTITGAGLLLLVCGLRERPAQSVGG